MKIPPDPNIERILRALRRKKSPHLLAFDFDGTLVGFRDDPEAVRLSRAQTALIARLARRFPVAIVSGRSLADLKAKFRKVPHVHLAGNHGFEIESGAGERVAAGRTDWARVNRARVKSLRREIRDRPELRGVVVEDKRFSLTAHFRKAGAPKLAAAAVRAWAKTLRPAPRVIPGVQVLNLVPADAAHKGSALKTLLRLTRCRSALFAGDDTTDEDVFRLRLGPVVTVKVGLNPRKTAAKYRLTHRRELTDLLRWLIREVPPDPS
jgi:trehalose 6-phosphate phosphatase